MPEYIDPAVKRLRERGSTENVTLLLGVSGELNSMVNTIEGTDATVENTLGRATLRVTAPATTIDDLIALDEISSIELEREDVRPLDEGNRHSRRRVIR